MKSHLVTLLLFVLLESCFITTASGRSSFSNNSNKNNSNNNNNNKQAQTKSQTEQQQQQQSRKRTPYKLAEVKVVKDVWDHSLPGKLSWAARSSSESSESSSSSSSESLSSGTSVFTSSLVGLKHYTSSTSTKRRKTSQTVEAALQEQLDQQQQQDEEDQQQQQQLQQTELEKTTTINPAFLPSHPSILMELPHMMEFNKHHPAFAAATTTTTAGVALPLITEGYSRLHSQFLMKLHNIPFPTIPPGVTEITIIFHAHGNPTIQTTSTTDTDTTTNTTSTRKSKTHYSRSRQTKVQDEKSQNFLDLFSNTPHVYWLPSGTSSSSSTTTSVLHPAFRGERIGRAVAQRIPLRISKLHIIGIGVGSFAADACVMALKQQSRSRSSSYIRKNIYIQETLIHPFVIRGCLDHSYGIREFGKWADYAQQIICIEKKKDNNTKRRIKKKKKNKKKHDEDDIDNDIHNETIITKRSSLESFHHNCCTKCAVLDISALRPNYIVPQDWPLVYVSRQPNYGFVQDTQKLGRGEISHL